MHGVALLLPDELLIFFALAAAFAVLLGALRLASALLVLVALLALAGPFLDAALEALPLWALLLLAGVVTLGLLRLVADLVLGRDAGAHFVAIIAAKLFLRVLAAPYRLLRAMVRMLWP